MYWGASCEVSEPELDLKNGASIHYILPAQGSANINLTSSNWQPYVEVITPRGVAAITTRRKLFRIAIDLHNYSRTGNHQYSDRVAIQLDCV